MNCNQVDNLLQDYIDGDLPEAQLKAITEHHQTCNSCENSYHKALQIRTLLQKMPVPPHSKGFVERVFEEAEKSSGNQKSSRYTAFAGAIAAGLATWFIIANVLFTSTTTDTPDNIYKVLVNNEVQIINVAIESEYELAGVKMSITLSPNLELAGYGNRTSINWDTRLKKGINIVKLPIVGLAAGNGAIITRIQMNGEEKVMHIQTDYRVPGNVWYPLNTTTTT